MLADGSKVRRNRIRKISRKNFVTGHKKASKRTKNSLNFVSKKQSILPQNGRFGTEKALLKDVHQKKLEKKILTTKKKLEEMKRLNDEFKSLQQIKMNKTANAKMRFSVLMKNLPVNIKVKDIATKIFDEENDVLSINLEKQTDDNCVAEIFFSSHKRANEIVRKYEGLKVNERKVIFSVLSENAELFG